LGVRLTTTPRKNFLLRIHGGGQDTLSFLAEEEEEEEEEAICPYHRGCSVTSPLELVVNPSIQPSNF
jgi:hypothetical protein